MHCTYNRSNWFVHLFFIILAALEIKPAVKITALLFDSDKKSTKCVCCPWVLQWKHSDHYQDIFRQLFKTYKFSLLFILFYFALHFLAGAIPETSHPLHMDNQNKSLILSQNFFPISNQFKVWSVLTRTKVEIYLQISLVYFWSICFPSPIFMYQDFGSDHTLAK